VPERRPRSCEECGRPLADDQRYCLACGARSIPPPSALARAREGARERWPGEGQRPAREPDRGRAESRAPVLRLPSAPVCVALVAAFLGFGILLGSAAKGPSAGALASSSSPHLKLVIPNAGHGGSGEGQGSGTTGSGGEGAGESAAANEPSAGEAEAPSAPARTASKTTAAPRGTGSSEPQEAGSGSSEGAAGGGSGGGAGAAKRLPPFKHVFIVMLSDQPYATLFGPASTARYVTHTLEPKGEVLARYDAVAHEELPNEIALLSGQGPTTATAANCPSYTDVQAQGTGPDEQVLGSGCVYPASTKTLPGQLASKHLTARAYVEGMDEPGAQAGAACSHPALEQADPSSAQTASTGPYATFRNPFVYFQSIAGSPSCARQDVGLNRLAGDLASGHGAPALAYIVPDRCHDGNTTPCTPGAAAGIGPADAFLARVVPQILRSKAYHDGGLLVITADEAPSTGEYADSSFCCGQPPFPNLPAGAGPARGHGGGTVGALLLSRYVKGGTTAQERFNHFSLLRTIEDVFALPHLGYAALPEEKALEPGLFLAKPAG
jgi:phosphatidylinositol-3-phosphatase